MRFKFFSHLALMVALNLLVKPIAIFGVDAQVQNIIGPEEYGIYFSLLNFTYLFNILLDLGITNFNIKHVAQYPHLAKQYFGKIIPIRLLLFFVYCFVALALSYSLNYSSHQRKIMWILVFNQFLISSIFYIRSYFAGLLLLKAEVLFSVLDKLLLILLAGYFLVGFSDRKMNMVLFVEIQTVSYLLTLFFALILFLYKIGLPKVKWHFSFNQLMLSKSFPYALLIVLMMIYNRLDSVMLERLSGSREAGIYAQAYRILDACFMFATLFSSLLFPIFSSMIKQKKNLLSLLTSSRQLLLTGAIILSGLCYLNASFLLNLIYDQEVQSSIAVFQLLMLSFIPVCLIVINGTLLTANGNLKFLNFTSFFGICLNFYLNYMLIPVYGAYGAALVSLLTQSLIALLQFIYVFRNFKLKTNFYSLFKYIGLAAIFVLASFFETNSLSALFIILLTSLLYGFLTHLFEWKLIKQFAQGKNN